MRSTDLLISFLLHGHGVPVSSGFPTYERPLVAAAAALAAGEPKRALRVLGRVGGPGSGRPREIGQVAAALRTCARALDLNWFPGGGGAVMSSEDITSVIGPPPQPMADPGAALVVLVAARLIPDIQRARAVADSSRVSGDTAAVGHALGWLRELEAEPAVAGASPVRAYVKLAMADVAHRGGLTSESRAALAAARQLCGTQPLLLARLSRAEGDMALEPTSHPELLGLRFDTPLRGNAPDNVTAQACYARADAFYAHVGARRGNATIALRRAHLARRRGDTAACAALAESARRQAREAGGGALSHLLDVHQVIDRLGAGENVPVDTLDTLCSWSRTDGSASFARGLVRLLVVRSGTWRDSGEALPALRSLRIARRPATTLAAGAELGLVQRAHVELADRFNVRRASAVLLAADSAEAVESLRGAPFTELAWMRAARLALALDAAAQALGDPGITAVGAVRLDEVVEESARLSAPSPMVRQAIVIVRDSARTAALLQSRHRGQQALASGHRDDARVFFERALEKAERAGQDLLRALLLLDLDRRAEARNVALALFHRGGLHPDHAVSLFLRLGDPATAQQALADLDHSGWTGQQDRPWEDPARRAELADALGHHPNAAHLSLSAVSLFEKHAAQLVRDTFRSAATDMFEVAGMYHTAVLAHLRLAQGDTGHPAVAVAFELSDRCRGFAVDTLRSLDRLRPGQPRDSALRWLRAGSAWAATHERLMSSVITERTASACTATFQQLRAGVLGAEEALDEAEAQVARHAPTLLTGQGTRQPGALLDEVQGVLADDAALIMYESFDNELIIWAVGRRDIQHRRLPVRARSLACDIRRFHTACATGRRDRAGAAGLAKLLIEPVASAVEGRRRLYIVPHRALALVPFHALPFGSGPLSEAATVSYLPSAALLTRPRAAQRPRLDVPSLVVGNPAYPPDRPLCPLPGAATEAVAIARLLGSSDDALTGPAATARNVTARAPGASVLHLAAHAIVDEQGPHLSHVALAGHDELSVGDVVGLDLTADLVVLSACHTGRGTATAGGDVLGLTRAALTAGARHLVVSLWPVDDEAGCLVMTALYEELVAGKGVADALTRAQRQVRLLNAAGRRQAYDMLRAREGMAAAATGARDGRVPDFIRDADGDGEGELPYFWAPFIHVGG
ncbi:CHAT domain-containing protein [Streptomyces sp. NPDC026206]|uniref:CHAT domain-containing protein n=1 Tax=Streptomyces sp. NPDC026206 TaxID=3157089 RepID=UPI0033F47EC7